ncbi:hypothetical protein [Microvirga makkahensis]|uniref:Uncharacterized protein n=1 Tax=Microvirga makkahensis TaxID=1128670 RepID=A0A7X3SPL9_9HYPH|nr:hypothetical protein [Microvirga makkahensis]MXQ12410.1 hypothetical protein [Microvirga makkahensis]
MLYIARQDRATDYRRQAQEARAMANWMSPDDIKHQLLGVAKHLEALADLEERHARKVAPARSPELKA